MLLESMKKQNVVLADNALLSNTMMEESQALGFVKLGKELCKNYQLDN